jgi:hypothetical protein
VSVCRISEKRYLNGTPGIIGSKGKQNARINNIVTKIPPCQAHPLALHKFLILEVPACVVKQAFVLSVKAILEHCFSVYIVDYKVFKKYK